VRRNPWAVLAIGVVFATLVFALGYSRGARSVNEATAQRLGDSRLTVSGAASSRGTATTARELALQMQVQQLEQRLTRLEASGEARDPVLGRNEPEEPTDPGHPSPARDYEAARKAALEHSENQFKAATGSSEWGKRFETACLSFRPTAGRVQSMACRAEMCRLEIAHDSEKDAARFVDEVELDPRFSNTTIRWFFSNPEKTRRVMFVLPAQHAPAPR
jgi:hypothetical protein